MNESVVDCFFFDKIHKKSDEVIENAILFST